MLSLGPHHSPAAPALNGKRSADEWSVAKGHHPTIDADATSAEAASPASGGGSRKKRMKAAKVDHTYRDFSRLSVDEVGRILASGDGDEDDDASGRLSRAKSKTNVAFPRKLYEMVTNPDFQHIICFMPHGRGWAVLNKEALVSEVLPKYFNHSRFESFNRQVNGWGFKRLMKRGPDHKSYYHECFLRGRPELTTLMVRLVNPGKRIPDRDTEPDFYDISSKNPLPEILPPPSPAIGQHTHSNAAALENFASTKDMGGGGKQQRRNSIVSTILSPATTAAMQPVSQVAVPPQASGDSLEQAFRLYQQLANASGSHPHPVVNLPLAQAGVQFSPQAFSGNPSLYGLGTEVHSLTNPPQAQTGFQFHSQALGMNPNMLGLGTETMPPANHNIMYQRSTTLAMNIASSVVPDGLVSAPPESQTNQPVVDLTSPDWLEEVLPSEVPSMKRSPSFLSDDGSSGPGCKLSRYNAEPDPLPEGAPLKTSAAPRSDEMSSLRGDRDPMLEQFAMIYYSRSNRSDSEVM